MIQSKIKLVTVGLAMIWVSGCATLTAHLENQERIQEVVKHKQYDLSVSQLKVKVIDYFSGWRAVTPSKQRKRIKEDIDKGFVYKGKYYQKYEPGLLDVVNTLSTGDKDYISDFFTKADFHTITDNLEEFKYVFDGMIFEGKTVGEGKSTLHVYSFSDVEHGPYKLDVNFMAFISKMGSLFTLRKGAVLLEDSMQYATRDMMTEIDLFKKIEPQSFEAIR